MIACAAFLDPWGTAVALGVILLVIFLVGRVRLRSPVVLAVALGVTLALVSDGARERASFTVPLICLAACFVIYMGDILWSVWQVRKMWPPTLPASLPTGHHAASGGAVGAVSMSEPGRPGGRSGRD